MQHDNNNYSNNTNRIDRINIKQSMAYYVILLFSCDYCYGR